MRTAALVLLILIGCGGDMQRISDLATGYDDAPSGYVEVKLKGTSTNATIYGDPDGLSALTGPQYTLDSNGALEAYANALVDIYVYTSAGTLVRGARTVEGGSTNVVYSGQSALGVTPVTGVVAVNQPIPLNTYLDRWKTNTGGYDWAIQKDVAASPATWTLKSLGVTVGTAFVSIKDPTYGAKGDGTTDDTTAIQNALNAAQSSGVALLVPAGTYNISDALSVATSSVNIIGVGNPTFQTTVTNKNAFTISKNVVMEGVNIKVATAAGANSTGYGISVSGSGVTVRLIGVQVQTGTYEFARAVVTNTATLITEQGSFEASTYSLHATTATVRIIGGEWKDSATTMLFDNCDAYMSNAYVTSSVNIDSTTGFCSLYVVGSNFSGDLTIGSNARIREAANRRLGGTVTNNSTLTTNEWNSMIVPYRGVVASATALPLVGWTKHDTWTVSGNTAITSIATTGFFDGQIVTLIFSGTATLTDGGNIKLSANLVATADDVITLVHVAGVFYELGDRSVN